MKHSFSGILLIAAAAFAGTGRATWSEIALSGSIEQVYRGEKVVEMTFTYVLEKDSGMWLAMVEPMGTSKGRLRLTSKVITFSDGTDVYEILFPNGAPLSISANLFEGSMPLHGIGQSVPLWLAFNLASDIEQEAAVEVPAPWPPVPPEQRPQRARATPGLHPDGSLVLSIWDSSRPSNSTDITNSQPRARLEGRKFQSFNGFRFPAEVKISHGAFDSRGNKFTSETDWYYQINVTSTTAEGINDFLPSAFRIVVTDRRFAGQLADKRHLSYVITNEFLRSGSPRIQALVETAASLGPMEKTGPPRNKTFLPLLLAGLLLFPAVLYWITRKAKAT